MAISPLSTTPSSPATAPASGETGPARSDSSSAQQVADDKARQQAADQNHDAAMQNHPAQHSSHSYGARLPAPPPPKRPVRQGNANLTTGKEPEEKDTEPGTASSQSNSNGIDDLSGRRALGPSQPGDDTRQPRPSTGDTVRISTREDSPNHKGQVYEGSYMTPIGPNHALNVEGKGRVKIPIKDVKELQIISKALKADASPYQAEINRDAEIQTVHYSQEQHLKASEYVVKGSGKIDITSHGLGSGIYTVGPDKKSEIPSYKFKVGLPKPLVLQNPKHGEQFISLSKRLQEAAGKMQQSGLSPEDFYKKNPSTTQSLAGQLQNVLSPVGRKLTHEEAEAHIKNTLTHFDTRYSAANEKTLVRQPINKLMKELGYESLATGKAGLDGFQNGNVLYNTGPIDDVVKYGRDGVNKPTGNPRPPKAGTNEQHNPDLSR